MVIYVLHLGHIASPAIVVSIFLLIHILYTQLVGLLHEVFLAHAFSSRIVQQKRDQESATGAGHTGHELISAGALY